MCIVLFSFFEWGLKDDLAVCDSASCGTCYIACTDLKLKVILLFQLLECWDDRFELPHLDLETQSQDWYDCFKKVIEVGTDSVWRSQC